LYEEDSGLLYRDWRDGIRGVSAFSEDYAGLAEGLLELHRATGNKVHLQTARRLVDSLLENFHDAAGGGFFRTRADTELWVREKPAVDGATVSANGIAIGVLLDLADISDRQDYRDVAWYTAAWAVAQLGDEPAAMSYALIAWPALLTLNPMQDLETGAAIKSP
jgi:uncharacterized protein YyaL (SSP411 family)